MEPSKLTSVAGASGQIRRLISAGSYGGKVYIVDKEFGVSCTCIKNSFKAVYGVSFYAFIKARKMESAAYMLEHTDKPVVEIAGEHGYDNSSKFASAFRSVKGVSPGTYRQQNQKNYPA